MGMRPLWCMTACLIATTAVAEDPRIPTEAEKAQAAKARSLADEAVQLAQAARHTEAKAKLLEALKLWTELFPSAKYPKGHAGIARALSNLGGVCRSLAEHDRAVDYYSQAVAMYLNLYPEGSAVADRVTLAETLAEYGSSLRLVGRRLEARKPLEDSVAISREIFRGAENPTTLAVLMRGLFSLGTLHKETGRLDAAKSALAEASHLVPKRPSESNHVSILNQLGSVQHALGEYHAARDSFTRALEMSRLLFGSGDHVQTATSINNLGYALQALGEYGLALEKYELSLAMSKRIYPADRYPSGHSSIAIGLNNLGYYFAEMRDFGKAHGYFSGALVMRRQLHPKDRFPKGHPDLATSLNNMGFVLGRLDQDREALRFLEEAVAMSHGLYGEHPHPSVAAALLNLSRTYRRLKEPVRATKLDEEALQINRALYPPSRYPRGHPDLVTCLNNLGEDHCDANDFPRAFEAYESALRMSRSLYPRDKFAVGHADLVRSLHNRGFALTALGRSAEALIDFREAFAMSRQLVERNIELASQEEMGMRLRQFRVTLDNYLSRAVYDPSTCAETFDAVWQTQAAVLRILERRRQIIANPGERTPQIQQGIDRLAAIRRQTARWLTDPEVEPAQRDLRLIALSVQQDRAERDLAKLVSRVDSEPRPTLRPRDLLDRFAPDVALISFVQSIRFEPNAPATLRYLAFVAAPNRPVVRLDLGDCKPIDEAVTQWRRELKSGGSNPAAIKLRELMWDRIAPRLAAATRTIYLSLDGELSRLPFAALPGKNPNTVLLEEYAFAVIPSPAWLAQRLAQPKKPMPANPKLLLVGSLDFGKGSTYPALTETDREIDRIRSLSDPRLCTTLTKNTARPDAIRRQLPNVEVAHFATHGFFMQQTIAFEKLRLKEYQQSGAIAGTSALPTGAALSEPLGYVGLVCSGANEPNQAGPDFGLLTGLDIVDLPLSKLHLCVLSACETGLGTITSGEGPSGLQRAFHLAGCDNVVCSLWNVNDAATAALMAKFYHEMWFNKFEPLAALRKAQLAIYYHPELIPDLAGERGAPKAKEALAVKVDASAKPLAGKRTDIKLWAAFVLSGVGK